jgi:hypothetical protein
MTNTELQRFVKDYAFIDDYTPAPATAGIDQ